MEGKEPSLHSESLRSMMGKLKFLGAKEDSFTASTIAMKLTSHVDQRLEMIVMHGGALSELLPQPQNYMTCSCSASLRIFVPAVALVDLFQVSNYFVC